MKKTKEIAPVLTAVYCINITNGNKDSDIDNLLRYLLIDCLNVNANMLTLMCISQTKESIMPQLKELLEQETGFYKFMENR